MPAISEKQRRFFEAVTHNPAFAKKVGVPQSVGKEFTKKDFQDELNEIKEQILAYKNSPLNAVATPLEKPDDADPCWEDYKQLGMKEKGGKEVPNCVPEEDAKEDSEAWQNKEGKNKNGGLNEKGRESYNKAHGGHLKAPQKEGSRHESFCARMKGMKSKLTSSKTANDPDSRINKSLRKWHCHEDAQIEQNLSSSPMPINKDAGVMGRASGILFMTDKGEILFLRRGNGSDYPNHWAVCGGHQEKGETLEEGARRECFEETGIKYKGDLELLHDDGQFATYLARIGERCDVKLNYEHTGYDWADAENPPMPMHPSLYNTLKIVSADTELDVAELISEGLLPSPQPYSNMHLLDIRITGTGMAYRSSIEEHVWRDPSLYLNDEFLRRCNGLTVIRDHPDSAVLNSKEFKDRAIGSILLPYIKGDEVWGIAKIYDNDVMEEILEGDISTSPSVAFDNSAQNVTLTTEQGEPLLIEGKPFLLDHIAIVTKDRGGKGVWDKGGDAQGVLLNNKEEFKMDASKIAPVADASGDKLDAILNAITGLAVRVDAMEKNMPAEPLMKAADKKRKDDDDMKMSKKDDDDDMRKDDDDEEDVPPFIKKKMKKDDDMMDDEKCDDDDMKKDAVSRSDKKRKDAHGVAEKPSGEMRFDEEEEEEEEAEKKKEAKMDENDEKAMKKDEEMARMADAQAKADSVYSAFGKSATRPLDGEKHTAYRKRLLRGLQSYSDAYKDVNLLAIKDAKLLDIAEKQIMADALQSAKFAMHIPKGSLYEVKKQDASGRTITSYKGHISAFLDEFKLEPMRAKKWFTNNVERN